VQVNDLARTCHATNGETIYKYLFLNILLLFRADEKAKKELKEN